MSCCWFLYVVTGKKFVKYGIVRSLWRDCNHLFITRR